MALRKSLSQHRRRTGEPTYVGIDVAKDRVAVRPTESWSASYEEKEVEILVAAAGIGASRGDTYRWPGAISSGPGWASGSGQSPPRLRQVHRPTGQSTPRSWPTLERRSNRRCARYVPTLGPERWWPVGVRGGCSEYVLVSRPAREPLAVPVPGDADRSC